LDATSIFSITILSYLIVASLVLFAMQVFATVAPELLLFAVPCMPFSFVSFRKWRRSQRVWVSEFIAFIIKDWGPDIGIQFYEYHRKGYLGSYTKKIMGRILIMIPFRLD